MCAVLRQAVLSPEIAQLVHVHVECVLNSSPVYRTLDVHVTTQFAE